MRRFLPALALLFLLPFLRPTSALACTTFSCGPLLNPSVQVVYTSPEAIHYDAELHAIVTGGYLDPLPIGSVTWKEPVEIPFGAGTLSTTALYQAAVSLPPNTIYLFVLGPEQLPEQHSGGFYAYHQEFDNARFGVVPFGWSGQVEMDFAHELVEGLADAEIADPCGYQWTRYDGFMLQTYLINGQCVSGPYSRP